MPHNVSLLLTLVVVTGCADSSSATHGITTAGVAAGIGSAGGFFGVLAGIAVGYAVDQGVKYGEREMQANVQQAIADAAGPLDEQGKASQWNVTDDFPLAGRSGTVQIARIFGEAIPCKDAVFTVADDTDLFVTTICRDKTGRWRWATAEPATSRWGTLQ